MFLGIALKRLIFFVFLCVLQYSTCVIEYVPSNCFTERFRAAVSVLVGPLLSCSSKLYWCRCACCCIIGQVKWWWCLCTCMSLQLPIEAVGFLTLWQLLSTAGLGGCRLLLTTRGAVHCLEVTFAADVYNCVQQMAALTQHLAHRQRMYSAAEELILAGCGKQRSAQCMLSVGFETT